jgi:4-hydroxybenzoate polyprenyltransferase/geranylgeranylglycerol-phosphate geranylgeranyltransferase
MHRLTADRALARPRPAAAGGKLLAHLEMLRPYTLFHPALLAIAGAELASRGAAPRRRVALAALVTTCGWFAGHYAGDYYDRDIDALGKPRRPIPSGRVSPREAFLTMLALIGAGCAAALALSPANLLLAAATTALGIGYSKLFKARALVGHLDRGVLGACAVAFGTLATGALSGQTALLMLLVIAHDAATNLVGAVRDLDGDRLAGCRTAPVVYGATRGVDLAAGLGALGTALGVLLMALARPNRVAVALYALAVAIAASAYGPLLAARRAPTRRLALVAHKRLVPERVVLTSAFVAARAPRAALLLLALALPSTLGLQRLLRDRYEPPHQRLAAPSA